LDVIDELELLKPVVQQGIAELDAGDITEPHYLNGTYAASCRIDKHSADSNAPQV